MNQKCQKSKKSNAFQQKKSVISILLPKICPETEFVIILGTRIISVSRNHFQRASSKQNSVRKKSGKDVNQWEVHKSSQSET
jgi:hypothetical protein